MTTQNRPKDGYSFVSDIELVQARIKNFLGYGNLSGDIWFVGMEEGGNESLDGFIKRFRTTSNGQIFDIYDDMREILGHMRWFGDKAPTQPTYRKLIYLLLFLRSGKEPTLEDIRSYQINKFGRKTSDHAVLELMPLPSKKTEGKDSWKYGSLGIDALSSKRKYQATYMPERIRLFLSLFEEYKPKLVVLYALKHKEDWEKIFGERFTEVIPDKLSILKRNGTVFAITPHSTARGYFNSDWRSIAEGIMTYCHCR